MWVPEAYKTQQMIWCDDRLQSACKKSPSSQITRLECQISRSTLVRWPIQNRSGALKGISCTMPLAWPPRLQVRSSILNALAMTHRSKACLRDPISRLPAKIGNAQPNRMVDWLHVP